MNQRAPHPLGFFPSRHQTLLLRAALLQGEAALEAFERWEAEVDLDRVDVSEQRLVPLLFRNLKRLGVEPGRLSVYKGVHHYWWYRNSRSFERMGDAIAALHAAGITDAVLLKGAAIVWRHYESRGERPMNDLDVLVPVPQLENALEALGGAGFTPTRPDVPVRGSQLRALVARDHAVALQDRQGIGVDLHWRAFHRMLDAGDSPDLWAAMVPGRFGDREVKVLCPADHLLHTCLHGLRWNRLPAIWWAADAVHLLRGEPGLDWERLTARAAELGVAHATAGALAWLARELDVPIDAAVLSRLRTVPEPWRLRLRNATYFRDPRSRSVAYGLWQQYRWYSEAARLEGHDASLRGFAARRWTVRSVWELPGRVVRRIRGSRAKPPIPGLGSYPVRPAPREHSP